MLPSKLKLSKISRCLPVLIAALIFAGCVSAPPQQQGPSPSQDDGKAGSAWYLQQMQQSSDDSKTEWQLLAIRALLNEGQAQQAANLLQSLPQSLGAGLEQDRTLLHAQLLVNQQNNAEALTLLKNLRVADLSASQQKTYYQTLIAANAQTPSLDLLRAYIAFEPMLSGAEHQQNIDDTWQALTRMTPEQMNSLVINADENTLQGWLELQQIWQGVSGDPAGLQRAINDWKIRYPNNPGAKSLPTQLSHPTSAVGQGTANIEKIALLLPLSGQGATFGQAIQQGFEAAKNGQIQSPSASDPQATPLTPLDGTSDPASIDASASLVDLTPTPTSPAGPAVQVSIYDTATQPLDQILTLAQQEGANLVVGPLLKTDVDALANSQTPLNILALNQPEHLQNKPNLCYFSLSPEDEARDAAQHIWQQNHRIPLLLIPQNALGDRIAAAFNAQWQQLGGGTVLAQRFGNVDDLRREINRGTGISLTGTPILTPQATNGLGEPSLTSAPTSIADTAQGTASGGVDAVYIIASGDEMSLIKPMIAMRNGSRTTAQLYASSRSAQSNSGPDFRLEMEGLQFSEIPLLSGAHPQLMQQALPAVQNDYSRARLYAMGMDAWSLANHFSELRQNPGFTLNGNTGQLSASADCVVNRKLQWLQFNQGQIVPVS